MTYGLALLAVVGSLTASAAGNVPLGVLLAGIAAALALLEWRADSPRRDARRRNRR